MVFLSMIFSENRYPSRIKCGTGFFGIMLGAATTVVLPAGPELPIIEVNGLGCRAGSAAEIKPIEPVWVMPA